MFTESVVRTNRLHCSDCEAKIKKGDTVIFDIEEGRMQDVFCESCSHKYEDMLDYEASRHPFDLDT